VLKRQIFLLPKDNLYQNQGKQLLPERKRILY
jgi:hypothetical protein